MAEITKTVIFYEKDKLVHTEEYGVPTEGFNLKRAIKNAAMEYCMTKEGRETFMEHGGFDYQTFYKYVPEDICSKHGFYKTKKAETILAVNCSEELFGFKDMEAMDEADKNPATQKIYETAVQFTRKWGVMETLDGTLPNQGTEENMNCMIAWATEFVNSSKTDSVDFFEQKMNEVKRKEARTELTDN